MATPFSVWRQTDTLSANGVALHTGTHRVLPVILHAPHHVQYWTPASIDSVLSRAGFGSIAHFPPREFRQKARANSIRRIAKRTAIATIGRLAGNRNIFVAGRK